MRTPLFLLVGFLLLAAAMLLGKLFSSNFPGATYAATLIFVVLWLVISGANLWVGVAKAGYTLNEEFPIFLLIFVVPTVVAISVSPDVMSGAPVFPGTRVPVQTLLEYLEAGDSIDEFLAGFPSVSRSQVIAFLERATTLAVTDAA